MSGRGLTCVFSEKVTLSDTHPMTGLKNSNLVFRSQNNTSDETNGVNNAVSCYKETV